MAPGFVLIIMGLLSTVGSSQPRNVVEQINPGSVSNIKNTIKWIKPHLEESRIQRYAQAIHKAANKFGIDPLTLVVIAHQESSFREKLPEGPAGEIGILQIRKNWLQNSKLRKQFKNVRASDLTDPEKSFEIAAWILSDLKKTRGKGRLPFWTYYNSRKLKNRLKYYVRVKRYLAAIEIKQKRNLMEEVKLTLSQKRITSSLPTN